MTDDQQQHTAPLDQAPPRIILGARVHYRGKQGRQTVRVADVTCTAEYLDPDGVTAGDIPALSSPVHVHLFVMTPSERGFFAEYDVPFSETLAPGTWNWPEGCAPPGWLPIYRAWQYQQLEREHGISGQALRGLYELEFPADGRPGTTVVMQDLAEKIGMPDADTEVAVDKLIELGLVERVECACGDSRCDGVAQAKAVQRPGAMRCRCVDPSKHRAQPSGEIDDVPPPPPASGDDEVVGSVPVGGGPEPAPADGGLSNP